MEDIGNQIITAKQLYRGPKEFAGREINVNGWVRTMRLASKSFGFIELNDGSFFKNIQIVFEENELENFDEIAKLTIGSSIRAAGIIVETPGAKQPLEMKARRITVESLCPQDYPLQKKRHSYEYLRTIAHLRPRTNTFYAVFRLRSALAFAIHKFYQERGFVYVHTPIITSSDAEGAGEMFRVTALDLDRIAGSGKTPVDFSEDFFGKHTSLTVSGQLEAESYCMAFDKVYTFGPTFRAENSNTARHAAEFWMIEPEIAFADINDNMKLAEETIKCLIAYCLKELPEEMEFFNSFIDQGLVERLQNILNSDFAKVTYTEAIDLLEKSGQQFDFPAKWGSDLQTEHERYLTEKIFKKPVFVIDYPKDIKAFYMRLNDDNKTVAAMDLLVPGVGEIIGGSQREERFDKLEKRMEELGLNKDDYWWYLDLRKYGGTKHAGFGMGFERLIMYLTGMQNIRDVIPFPRTPKSAEF
jgi:asparaginyl-tRNA synthetase